MTSPGTPKRGPGGTGVRPPVGTPKPVRPERMPPVSFYHAALIVPREELDGDPEITSAEAAVARAVQAQAPRLRLRAPKQVAANVLQRIGLGDLERHQVTREPASGPGFYTRLPSLGATAAFFREEQDEQDAKEALGEEYELVRNFSLSAIPPVMLGAVAATRGRATPEAREWPEEAGVA